MFAVVLNHGKLVYSEYYSCNSQKLNCKILLNIHSSKSLIIDLSIHGLNEPIKLINCSNL